MRIYLVRHPPPIGIEGLCYGRLEVTVTQEAIAAAVEAVSAQIPGKTLEDARVYCSPSSRCLELARHLASPGEPTPAEDLMEMDFGRWQGLAWGALPREQLDAWAKDVWRYRPGGGESAEMVAVRWQRWLSPLRSMGGSVVAVTHAGVIRVALARTSRSGADAALTAPVAFGSVHLLDFPPHGMTFPRKRPPNGGKHRGTRHG